MIRENLADLQFGRGKRNEAIALLDEAAADLVTLKSGGERSTMLAEHFGNLAGVFDKVGEADRALAMSRNADDFRTKSRRAPAARPPGAGTAAGLTVGKREFDAEIAVWDRGQRKTKTRVAGVHLRPPERQARTGVAEYRRPLATPGTRRLSTWIEPSWALRADRDRNRIRGG